MFFSEDESFAKAYAGEGPGSVVESAEISTENIFDPVGNEDHLRMIEEAVDQSVIAPNEDPNEVMRSIVGGAQSMLERPDIADWIKSKGFGGVAMF